MTGFYIFENDEIISELSEVKIAGKTYFYMEVSQDAQERSAMVYEMVTIDEVEVMGWKFESQTLTDYVVVQLMEETGEIVDYLYSAVDGAMIRYPDMAPVSTLDYGEMVNGSIAQNNEIERLELFVLMLGVLCATLTGALGFTIFKLFKIKGTKEVTGEELPVEEVECSDLDENEDKSEEE